MVETAAPRQTTPPSTAAAARSDVSATAKASPREISDLAGGGKTRALLATVTQATCRTKMDSPARSTPKKTQPQHHGEAHAKGRVCLVRPVRITLHRCRSAAACCEWLAASSSSAASLPAHSGIFSAPPRWWLMNGIPL